jgi:hypothetical protein
MVRGRGNGSSGVAAFMRWLSPISIMLVHKSDWSDALDRQLGIGAIRRSLAGRAFAGSDLRSDHFGPG